MLIRNDDVAADTTLHEIQTFCEICDRYGVTPIHAITPIGNVRPVSVTMDNPTIRRVSGTALFAENRPVVEYLEARSDGHGFKDRFAVHGLWHTHAPSAAEVAAAHQLLAETRFTEWDFNRGSCATCYFAPPFNEGEYGEFVNVPLGVYDDSEYGLQVLGKAIPRLEEYLDSGDPGAEIVYLHSWRFEHGPFTWKELDSCLKRLTER